MLNFLFTADGNRIEPEQVSLEANRSFQFGDGFFETIRLNKNGLIPLAVYHAQRISRSATLLEFSDFIDFREVELYQLVGKMKLSDSESDRKLRLVFFRQGPGSYAPEETCRQLVYAACGELELPFLSLIENVRVSEKVRIFPSGSSWVKSTSALPYVLAGLERKKLKSDEMLLLSPEGWVVEGSFSSICWEDRDGIHFTPRELGGIDSCMRRFLEDYFHTVSVPFTEKRITAENLMKESRWVCFASALSLRFCKLPDSAEGIPGIFTASGFELYQT